MEAWLALSRQRCLSHGDEFGNNALIGGKLSRARAGSRIRLLSAGHRPDNKPRVVENSAIHRVTSDTARPTVSSPPVVGGVNLTAGVIIYPMWLIAGDVVEIDGIVGAGHLSQVDAAAEANIIADVIAGYPVPRRTAFNQDAHAVAVGGVAQDAVVA